MESRENVTSGSSPNRLKTPTSEGDRAEHFLILRDWCITGSRENVNSKSSLKSIQRTTTRGRSCEKIIHFPQQYQRKRAKKWIHLSDNAKTQIQSQDHIIKIPTPEGDCAKEIIWLTVELHENENVDQLTQLTTGLCENVSSESALINSRYQRQRASVQNNLFNQMRNRKWRKTESSESSVI